ncbi:MAG: ABC transporter permease [Lachnospiraceae bacterium]
MRTCTVTVSGIFDNYIYNYVMVSADTYADAFGEWEANTVLVSVDGVTEEAAKTLTEMSEITSVSQLSFTRDNVDRALSCLHYIICMVVLFSGALAFIVIFNLTNINLAERSREIATVQVLGFYPKETENYVLRENLVLSVLASFIGMPLGTLFHRIVMSMIRIDSITFLVRIAPLSYVMAFFCTVLFAFIVNLFMKRQIDKIHMTESLKAVE